MKSLRGPFQDFRIAFGQINPTVGDFEANAKKICSYIQSAEENQIDLVIFPELSLCGYPVWDLATNTGFVKKNLQFLKQISNFTKGKSIYTVLGFIDFAAAETRKNYNALAVIHNGKVVQTQYKTLLPTYDVFLEEIFFTPAKNQKTFKIKNLTFGPTICEDIWDDAYTVKPAKKLAQKGAQILINISASPYHREALSVRSRVVLNKAKQYGVWVMYVNQVGGQDDLIFDGRSFVSDPQGRIRYMAQPFKEGLYEVKLQSRALPHAPIDTTKEIYQALVLGLSDYIRKNGFKKVVIGLSGGIDSALVAALAADALGPKSVIGVALPGPFSSPMSLRDAEALAKNLGIEFRVKSIVEPYQAFVQKALAKNRIKDLITTAMENLQARLRGLELMYISNDEGALLLTTGNKSELAMGYSTLYGDMCGGLSVIGDVYKSDVYRLAKYRNSISKAIPAFTISRPPSAELRPNQKDQDSLPPYEHLDLILYLYIEKNHSVDEIIKKVNSKDISKEIIRKVINTVDHNEYKRRQLPPCLRITEKAWFGRRMPITNLFKG